MRAIVGALALAGGAYFAWRALAPRPQESAPVATQPREQRTGAPGLGPITAPLAAAGPLGAAAAVLGASADAYYGGSPEQQAGFKRIGDKTQDLLYNPVVKAALGGVIGSALIRSSPTVRRRASRDRAAIIATDIAADLDGVEQHALNVWTAISRDDVVKWWIDQDASVKVVYGGFGDDETGSDASPFVVKAPGGAVDYPAAFAYEAIVRALGRPQQAGVGPLRGDFYASDQPGFDPRNPFAPTEYLQGGGAEGSLAYHRDRAARR